MSNSKYKSSSAKPSESGFTLLESLMAIVVLTILLTGIAPMIFLSTATRIQARRVERATQAAREYIDGVRTGAIFPPNAVVVLNEFDTNDPNRRFVPRRFDTFATVAAPAPVAASATCSRPNTPVNPPTPTAFPYCLNPLNPVAAPTNPNSAAESLYCFSANGNSCSPDNPNDLIIQAYRSVTRDVPSTAARRQEEISRGYILSLRVYRADAFRDSGELLRSGNPNAQNPNRPSTTQRSSGASLNRKAPILELTTEVTRATDSTDGNAPRGTNFQDFCERFGGCTR
ncbi:MAG: hormogonium polysaccharide secretion pseudopilin HpsB [Desertifilum sp.]|nr:hormogonium polysaccharide secretion pseudopilin HpsB [Desertifilum sp.]